MAGGTTVKEKIMVRIFYGKNNIDLAGFAFDEAKKMMEEGYSGALILVPDRYTLEMERKAFSALNAGGLMDIEIMSFSRMATKLLPRAEGVKYIDDLSRAMILRKVISEKKEELRLFARSAEKADFVRLMGDVIQDFKQNRTSPEAVLGAGLVENTEDGGAEKSSLLTKKLKEIGLIFEAYEEEIKGKFFDTEDYLERLSREINRCEELEGKAVFVHGFDFFSARLITVMEEISKKCENLTVLLTTGRPEEADYNLFEPVNKTIRAVAGIAKTIGERGYYFQPVPDSFAKEQNEEIAHLGRNIYAFPKEKFYNDQPEDIMAFSCSSAENEVLLAARLIKELVKNQGYRFKDIGVAVSDLPSRAGLIRRVFEREGIKYFDNSKYNAIDNRFMQFILCLCSLEKGYGKGEDLMRIAETGVFDINHDEKEVLENYAYKYKIETFRWQRPFSRIDRRRKDPGEAEAELAEAERIRASLIGQIESLFEALADCTTGGEYSEKLFAYFRDELKLEEKIVADSDRLKAAGRADLGEATLQLWEKTRAIFERLSLLLEKYVCERDEFFDILRAGVESLEIGLIPATVDSVIFAGPEEFGEGEYKAVIFMGFCAGLVPDTGSSNGLLSEREKARVNELAGQALIGASDRTEKEKLAVYRTLTAPERKLYLTWYAGGNEDDGIGGPSSLFDSIKKIFPKIEVVNIDERHLVGEELTNSVEGYISRGAMPREYLEPEVREALFGPAIVSPTSLENYGHCPFAHFLRYGIKADERKVFEAAPPEMGTIYHDVIMKFSEKLTEDHMWLSADEAIVESIVGEIAEESVKEFAEGQLFEGPEGEYRISRIKNVCERTAYMVAQHVQKGAFSEFLFETPFGRNKALPPVELELEDGSKVLVEGRIDRIDIADAPLGSCVKVIDYKSGAAKIDQMEIETGYRLQLMLYMMAAKNGLSKDRPTIVPAGVFYFKIQEPSANTEKFDEARNEGSDKLEEKLRREFKMDGIMVDEPWIIEAIDEDMGEASEAHGYSEIVKLQKLTNGEVKPTPSFGVMSSEDFEDLMETSMLRAERFAGKMMRGDVTVEPMKIDKVTDACNYCRFHSICTVDTKLLR